jgi:zinc/manganese transport system ATP-binding protein
MTEPARAAAAARPSAAVPDAVPAVRLDHAEARLGGGAVWSDVSVTVRKGEFVALLGPNGAGKSTLLKVILGLLPLAAGEASVLGAPPGERNAQIGYLPQRRTFDATTRVRGVDLVRLGLDGHRWGVPLPAWLPGGDARRAERARVAEMIELVGATAYAHRAIGELSGGEQQRLLIAQALVRRPRLLMLDEPLDSLDLPNQSAVAALLQRICASEHVAVLLVAHDVNPILPYLDRVVYLAGGTAAAGRPEEVITPETLTRLYGVPIEVVRTPSGRLVVVGQPEAPHVHGDRHDHG